jgi:hypothetical protein
MSRKFQALTSFLPLTSNYPMTQILTWPFLIALAEIIFSRILAMLPWQQAINVAES